MVDAYKINTKSLEQGHYIEALGDDKTHYIK